MANFLEDLVNGLGNTLTGGGQRRAADYAQKSADVMNGVELPNPEDMKIQLEDLVSQGVLTPEDAQYYAANPSAMNQITTDPNFSKAQMDALSSLQDIGNSGGMTTADTANLAKISSDEASKQRGSREAILQNAQSRGLGGSGLELMSQMQNQQDSATRQNQRDLDVAGMAQQRALQSLQAAGQMGGQMQAQQFGQQAQVAGANDAIDRFNTQNKTAIGQANTAARNAAQATNLGAAQKLSDANTATHNAQTQYNAQLPQQAFEDQLRKAGGVSNAYSGQMQQATQAGTQNAGFIGSALEAGGSALAQKKVAEGAGGAAIAASDMRLKEDIEPFDASKFLDSLTSYKYNYKNPDRDGKGTFAGPMAQDLEKTPEGNSLVEDTPEGKRVDYGKGFGTILAALTDVHNRVKHLEGK